MKESTVLMRGHIVNSTGISQEPGFLGTLGDTITYLGQSKPQATLTGEMDFDSYYICPGFIDIHTHGAGGSDVSDATAEALDNMTYALAKGGTTSFLATTMSAPQSELIKTVKCIAEYIRRLNSVSIDSSVPGARLIGIHLEGPFLNPGQKGAQKEDYLREPDIGEIEELVRVGDGWVKMMTIAPELLGAMQVIRYAKSQGIIVAMGHSDAGFEKVSEAVEAGLTHASHGFNAMGKMHHRNPGTVGAMLGLEQITADVVPDGIHVHPAVIGIMIKAKGIDRVCAVTDSIRASGLSDGEYQLGGQKVNVMLGKCFLSDGTIAGSVLSMAEAVRVLVKKVGISLPDAIKMASLNPARVLNLDKKGCLSEGMDADIVVLDRKLNVVMTMVAGRIVYGPVNEH